MRWERRGWEVGAEGPGRCKTESSKKPLGREARRAASAPHRLRCAFFPSPLLPRPPSPDSINSKDAHTEPPGCVQVKPISVNFPTRLSAQITRAPNVPFPGIWFPFPPPSPSLGAPPFPLLKNSEDPRPRKKPAQRGAEWAPSWKTPPSTQM